MFQDILYHVEPGSMTGDNSLSPNLIYVSKDGRKKWHALHKFVFVSKLLLPLHHDSTHINH